MMATKLFSHSNKLVLGLVSIVAMVGFASLRNASAGEPWADRRLDIAAQSGLQLWLDAASQPAARKSLDKSPIADGQGLAAWYDGSGRGRHMVQPSPERQPLFVASGSSAAARFDGVDDFLAHVDWQQNWPEFTVVAVASAWSNEGYFRSLLGMNANGRNDYVTGLNIDQGPSGSNDWRTVNIEGHGFGGARNLADGVPGAAFGKLRQLTLTSKVGHDGLKLFIEGKPAGRRARTAGAPRCDSLYLGARIYSNESKAPWVQGFWDGDVYELLIFDRVLDDAQRQAVETYLAKKYADVKLPVPERVALAQGKRLKPVESPPIVQMLVPGFEVRQLPVEISNVNFVRYRRDGKLLAGGYDGKLRLLSDTDGDGLEDRVELFWEDPSIRAVMGMTLFPADDPRGDVVAVATVGKIVLIIDRDRDGKADEMRTIAEGWPVPKVSSGGVSDAMGVTLDHAGNLYFGLGTDNFTNGYLVDPATGKATYDPKGQRGTIQRIAAESLTPKALDALKPGELPPRENACSGVRFSVGLAVNNWGDLFCTDQEGATWLSNGNPFDELLHIQPGRHYGFPPRHPRHLPGVLDEPSVMDYGPQHQSTCGLLFNEPINNGPLFGPAWWRGDALVAGESRGKIYRTRLAKTWHGYVARNELIACLGMLAIDLTPTPAGGLVVTCHSGGPDWGTGPRGAGSLFQIRPTTERRAPQPVACWPTSPTELRIAFDAPLDPAALGAKQGGEKLGSEKLGANSDALKLAAAIEFGRHVSPGDRFESIRPGYEVIRRQLNAVREQLVVHATQLSADRRTIIVTTAPHSAATRHAVTLEGIRRDGVKSDENSAASAAVKTDATTGVKTEAKAEARTAAKQEAKPDAKVAASKPVAPIEQHATVDLGYDLTGVVATWTPTGGEPLEIWLPHLDLTVSRAWTTGSAAHDAFWRDLDQRAGRLVLKTLLDVRDVLRPAVQEGATIDFTLPPERVTLQVAATGPLTGSIAGQALAAGWTPAVQTASPDKATANDRREQMALVAIPEKYATPARVPVELSIEVAAGRSAQTSLALFTNEDERRRAVPVRRLLVPWAAKLPDEPIDGGLVSGSAVNAGALPRPELAGGSWSRGRQLFMADQPGCVKCHAVDGQGGVIGPALGNLRQRDVASVLRDIRQPSYSIHPEYLASTVELKSGKLLTGTVRPSGTRFEIADNQGKVTAVERDEIESIEPSPKSIMPDNLLQNLSASQVKDLLTFLLTDGPRMPRDGPPQRPAPRKRAEVAAVLADSAPADSPEWKKELEAPPLEVVLVAGPKDHGPGEHDYPAWLKAWSELLRAAPRTNVSVASPWPSAEQKERGQVFVFYQQGTWSADRAKDVDGWLARGAGLVYIHYAVDGGSDAAGMADRIGWAWRGGQSKFRHGPLDVAFSTDPHPITRHFTRVHWHDESYWNLVGAARDTRLLGTGVEDGAAQPLFWSREQGRGRVFVSIPGHYSWSFDDPLFRILLLRGIAWSANRHVDRFNEVVPLGADSE